MTFRVLFITSTRIGDAILSSGLIRHVSEKYPETRWTIACGPLPADLFRDMPGLDEIHIMTKSRRGGHWLRLWLATVGKKWDMVIDLRSSALAWLVPTGKRFVYRKGDDHRVRLAAATLKLAEPPSPHIYVSRQKQERATDLVGDGPVLAIGPTANWIGKTWPAGRFKSLTERLTSAGGILPGAKVMVLGAPHERDQIAGLLASIPPDRLIDLVGRQDLLTVFACLRRASLYVGNDSGLMHLAAAAGIPTLGLFGPSNEKHYAPWGDKAMSVRGPQSFAELTAGNFRFDDKDCHMLGLDVDRVEEAAMELWRRHGIELAGEKSGEKL